MVESVTLRDDGVASDAALIAAVRTGSDAAATELYQRHAGAAWVVARQYSDGPADADDVVADAFAAVLGALGRGNGPEVAFRAYLFTVVRRVAAARREAGRRVRPTDDLATLEAGTALAGTAEEPALAGFERGVVARAFHSLPERWQAVLWHTEVEGLSPAAVAPLLGLTANGVAALAYRAREGLRQAYLQQHLEHPGADGCRAVSDKLGSYVRGGLAARDARKVEEHLEGCGDCRALVLELQDVNHGMRAVIAPLVLGLAGLGALAHTLPIGGGIASGLAALHGGAAGGGAAGAGAAGAGAAGAGAAGAGAAGAAGVGAAGGAATVAGVAAGVTTGAAGLAASLPLGVIALTVGGLVIAGATVVGAVTLLGDRSSPDSLATSPSASASASSSADATPTTAPTSTAPATPAPTDLPTSTPVVGVPVGTQVVSGQSLPSPTQTGQATAPPSDQPVSPPPSGGPAQPTATATPPPAPASVSVVLPAGGLQLDAGGGDQSLTFGIANSGDLAAQNLVADVTLPAGFGVAGLSVGNQAVPVAGRFAAAGAEGWICTTGETASTARCDLAELPGRTSQQLTLDVTVDESFAAADGDVSLHVSGTDVDFQSTPIPVSVRPAPTRLELRTAPASPAFVTDVPSTLHLDLANVGGTTGDVRVHVALPAGLRWTQTGTSPAWTCQAGTGSVDCSRPGVIARTAVPLDLVLVAGAPADVAGRSLDVSVAPAGRAAADTTVPFSVSRPVLSVASVTAQVGASKGTVSFQVSNAAGADSATATDVAATVKLPASLEADRYGVDNGPPPAGETRAWCDVVDASTLSCHLPDLAPGASAAVLADVRVRGAAVGVVQVDATATGSPPATGTGVVRTASGDLRPRAQLQGGWAVTEVGAPLLSCGEKSDSRCRGALDKGDADNNGLTMTPIDQAAPPLPKRDGVAVPVSSSTRLTVPAGRQIAFAGLYWSANRGQRDAFSGPLGTAQLRGPSGAWTPVGVASAADTTTVTDNKSRTYYESFVDVTSLVAAQVAQAGTASTTWSLADAAVSRTRTDTDPTYYAGWALVVVYADPGSTADVTVYDGAAWIGTSAQPPVFWFVGQAGAQVRVGVVAWEGDRGSTGDRLTLGDSSLAHSTALTPVRWDGSPGQSTDAFDSTATGWNHANSLGVDAKGFLPVTLGSDIGSLTASTTGDQYLIGAVTIRTTAPTR